MDEALLRQQMSSAARQLWMRGLIVADGGLITTEAHRRRYLVTPPGIRRSNLADADMAMFDLAGHDMNTDGGPGDDLWFVHRIAYQIGLERAAGHPTNNNSHTRPDTIGATITATPPMTLALVRLRPEARELKLSGVPGVPVIPIVANLDEPTLRAALARSSAVVLGGDRELFCVAPTVWDAVNMLERIEHAAAIEVACHRQR